ncbi:TIGR03667 family PPOX class F420-dependent oxidoreductase [Solirubrobacter sp. CPCC 204708]|uniref:TIGR03667 family PPOX class F420-dependent oxidoreductase n=1 Tax=Solirubrobacter deserti TaxID=2282478 RepID=A0ABT4RDS2_9ACTN|nr:TIGR03667 family PPOX class F420-dependent oxidoreductase [Solirubrobacter deserti]MBE2314655.1 TIGR03667 family PPOX class F420-dependent oxidoreductase [Solirubrobacter deserti]MDA0136663.1 TIGR03667 family PPOX class F420-dependent oxidoreductase [Solirubrobacter deserti]
MIDEATDFGQRAARHLREDEVVWLTTVTPGGQPVPNPVWFLWDGATNVRLYTLPKSLRVKTIESNPRVSLNFRGTETGGDIVVLNGRATIVGSSEPAHEDAAYVEKYQRSLSSLKMTPEAFAAEYSVAVDIELTKVRGF